MQYRLLLAGAYLAASVFGAPVAPATEEVFTNKEKAIVARNSKSSCFDVDAGVPGNMHWNDRDQFVVVDNHKCLPKLALRNGSCRHHQDLSTKCTAFCQTSAFHFFTDALPLMGGKMCRAGEACEIRHERSFHVEVSNTEVVRHVIDATASVSPSITWGFGFDTFNLTIPIPGSPGRRLMKRDGTPMQPEDDVITMVMDAMEEQDREMAARHGAANKSETAVAAPMLDGMADLRSMLLTIPIPYPTITNPTATIALTLAGHWTHDWTHTYHHATDKASFTSITHKQVPGEGCGAFWAVPVAVGYCGWVTSPRFPPAVHDDAMKWLAETSDPYEGSIKMGRWGNADHQQWNVTDGRCPVNYHEYPFCYASPLSKPGVNGEPDEALQRTVWRPYDCSTGRLMASEMQPREVRQQLNFNEFFKYHIRHDPRMFNPQLVWNPSDHQEDDRYYEANVAGKQTQETQDAEAEAEAEMELEIEDEIKADIKDEIMSEIAEEIKAEIEDLVEGEEDEEEDN